MTIDKMADSGEFVTVTYAYPNFKNKFLVMSGIEIIADAKYIKKSRAVYIPDRKERHRLFYLRGIKALFEENIMCQ